ncbi:MAG: Gfo/Idh/MocA family protein [Armatimonadota bacterium]
MSATENTLGWGIIGCGVIAPTHIKAVQATDGAEFVACCDVVEEKAQERADEFGDGDVKVYRDLEDMLNDPDVDVVSICTPSGMHSEQAIMAAEAGKHILCEKPMDVELKKIDAMIAAAKENNVKLSGVFQRRTYESSNKVRDAVRSGKLGRVVIGDCYQKYFRSHEYYASGDWRATWELDGGGALMNQGVHGIDLLLYIMGDVKRINANARTLVRNIAVEDTAVATLEFANGALGVIEGTTSITPGYGCKIQISGDDGTIEVVNKEITMWDIPGEEEEIEQGEDEVGTARDATSGLTEEGHTSHVADMVDAINNDREPQIPGREARRAVEVIKAIYKSSREGGATVELPLSYEDDGPGIG